MTDLEDKRHYKKLTRCRICDGKDLTPYLDLGSIPLVNSYAETVVLDDARYPLKVYLCGDCSLSQLDIVVDPSYLYSEYAYRSSISRTFRSHCNFFASTIVKQYKLNQDDLVVDIASNDGCLLSEFKKNGTSCLGVEPAENLAKIANESDLQTITRFWSIETAEYILNRFGAARVITATNVLAHVDDIHSFLIAVNVLLAKDGLFVVEVPYLVNFINKKEFDTVYHEHLSYFLLKPLSILLGNHDLEIYDVQQFIIHGGTIRVYIRKKTNQWVRAFERLESIEWLMDLEQDLGMHEINRYSQFRSDVEVIKRDLVGTLASLKNNNKKIAAYGASAKGSVLLNFCEIGRKTIDYIIDDTPEKQGKFSPGNHIPIVNNTMIDTERPDYLVLLAWNFAEELIDKTAAYQGAGGRYIIPIPSLRVI